MALGLTHLVPRPAVGRNVNYRYQRLFRLSISSPCLDFRGGFGENPAQARGELRALGEAVTHPCLATARLVALDRANIWRRR
jgi:hypothetical protein